MTDRSPPNLADRFRAASGALGLAVAVVGACVLAGWLLGLPRLTDFFEAAPEAKFNAGLCLILCGIALGLRCRVQPTQGQRRAANALAAAVVAIAALTLLEVAGGRDLGIDNLVVREPPGALGAFAPGRMAPTAAAIFLLHGSALLLLDARTRRGYRPANALALVAALGSLFVASGYVYGVEFFSGPGAYARIAPPIVLGQLLLGIGVMIARPDCGVTAVLARPGLGGRTARRLFPLVLVLPLVIGDAHVLVTRAGLASDAFVLAAATTALAAITGALVLATSRVIEAQEAEGAAATEALRKNEARLDEIVGAVPFGAHLCALRADGHLVLTGYSPSADRILGIDHRPLVGKLLEEAFPGNVGTEIPDAYRRVATTGESWSSEQVAYRAGSIAGAFDVRAVNTGPGRMAAFFADITERKRAEEALRASEEKFSSAFQTSPYAITITHAEDGKFDEINDAFTAMTGFTREEALAGSTIGLKLWVNEEDRRRVVSSLGAGRAVVGQEFQFRTKSGAVITGVFSAQVLRLGQHPCILSSIADITDRKRAEEALRESEARYALTLDAVNDGLWDWNVPTGDALFSPRYYALLGYDDGEFPANYASWRLLVHPEDIDQVEKQLGLGVESGAGFAIDLRMKMKSGRWLWVSIRGMTVERDAAGKALRLIGTLSDITDRKRAEEALRDLNATLEQKVEERTVELAAAVTELDAFSYSVSHDLRAPLRSLDGFSRILLDEFAPALDPAAQRYLGLVRKNAQQMGQLVDDLLAFSRLGRRPLRRSRVEPADLVRECLRDLEPEYGARVGAVVVVEPLPSCDADPALLKQVWLNLLANACKFTSARASAEIRVGCRDDGGTAVYFVSDNGVGFDMAYAAKLFGVFQRQHRAEDYEGTGVGLALVQRIVHRHGGRIWAESAVDRGATFFFTLGEELADGREGS